MAAKPYIISDGNWFAMDIIFHTSDRIHGVYGSIKTALRSDQAVVADCNFSGIQKNYIKICKEIFPYMDVVTEIAVKRRLDKVSAEALDDAQAHFRG